ncbi:MAG: TonB-dependent receptor [Acidobacteriota bacterium]
MRLNKFWLVAALALAIAVPAAAQVATGRIEVTAVDGTGAVLPGVLVEVAGPQNGSSITGPDGAARFLNLPPGTYQIKATLAGFAEYLNKTVPVVAGGNVQLKAALAVGGVKQQVDVTAETPVIDAKKTGTATNVTLEELQNIPSARDPWVVMQTVPGIIIDRVNVGGSESGQQSGYQAKGASGADNTWNMDGIPVTDMAAVGSTPTYYDFDMFQEMNVTTGGSDMSSATGGVGLNFILKSGGNTPHGSARIYFENESMQSNNMDAALATALGSPNGKGNRTHEYKDMGFEVGFPIVKDRLWAWGSIGKTDVYNLTIRQAPDNTFLKNWATKIQGQVSRDVRASFTWFHGDKQKFGRSAGATRPPETTLNQKGPSDFYKGEMNFVVSNNLFLSVRASRMPSGFQLQPQGGMDKNVYYDDSGVWHGSIANYVSDRPQKTAMADGSYFKGNHELKFGFSWRQVTVNSTSQWPTGSVGYPGYSYSIGYPDMLALIISPWASQARANYTSGWIGDTITMKRATITLGVRYDHQTDGTLPTSEPAITGFTQYLPAITAAAVPNAIVWNSLSPRAGINFAVDEARKTQLRASYARFASQLGNGSSSVISPVQYRYIYFYGTDKNGDHVIQPSEMYGGLAGWSGFDPANPGKLTSNNKLGNYHTPTTDEFIGGIDHELFKNFGVSASFTYRYFNNFNWNPYIGLRSTAYTKAGTVTGGPLPDGTNFSIPYYAVTAANLPATAAGKGTEFIARDGYHQRYWGIEASATKRLSDKWMARFGFSTNDHREYFDNPATAMTDLTPGPSSPQVDGGLVVTASGGSGKSGIYQVLPKYQFIANGMYQAPLGIDLGMNMVMRQGFAQPWYKGSVTTGDVLSNRKSVLLVTDVGANRLPTVTSLDVRIGKVIKIQKVSINVDLDVFNVLNAGTVLGKQYNFITTGVTGFNQTLEIMNPRIMRIGARIGF